MQDPISLFMGDGVLCFSRFSQVLIKGIPEWEGPPSYENLGSQFATSSWDSPKSRLPAPGGRKGKLVLPVEAISEKILTIRGKKVILASDLAEVYGVPTKALNQAVKRNAARFPADFAFQVTREEAKVAARLRSQIVTLKRGQHIKYLPHVFTEHGAIMAATVLNSPQAIQMSVFVVRAFVKMREALVSRSELERRLLRIENVLLAHDESIRELYDQIRPLLLPPPEPLRRKIGFEAKEAAAPYGKRKSVASRKQVCDGN